MPSYMSHLQYSSMGGGYNSQVCRFSPDILEHASPQNFPVVMTDDLVSGTQHDGKLSPVR